MANDSSTGGPLAPTTDVPAPLEGVALYTFVQGWIVGITGLAGNLVRPRWQLEPPNLPDVGTDWAALGITRRPNDVNAWAVHDPTAAGGTGLDYVGRQEILACLLSFYGPDADLYAEIFREGVQVAQNREVLQLAAFGFVDADEPVTVPELIKQRWLNRVDAPFRLRRGIIRSYPVRTVVSAPGTVSVNDQGNVVVTDAFDVTSSGPF